MGWRICQMAGRRRRKQTSKWERESAFRAQSVVKEGCYSVCVRGTYYVLV
jgi:hypothetical protein